MCVTDPWAHMSFMHSILSLKLGVTIVIMLDTLMRLLLGLIIIIGDRPILLIEITPNS